MGNKVIKSQKSISKLETYTLLKLFNTKLVQTFKLHNQNLIGFNYRIKRMCYIGANVVCLTLKMFEQMILEIGFLGLNYP